MRVPFWLKVGWTVWVLVWAPVYWHQYGAQNFLYFCDLGVITAFTVIGMSHLNQWRKISA